MMMRGEKVNNGREKEVWERKDDKSAKKGTDIKAIWIE